MTHLMIIGGTGMLRGVALECASRGWTVSVVARREALLIELANEAKALAGQILPLCVDYTCSDLFVQKLQEHCQTHSIPSICIAWIHNTAPDATRLAARELVAAQGQTPLDFIRVLTRLRTQDPQDRTVAIPCPDETELCKMMGLTYRKAILGWVVEPGESRWLTRDEIAKGVIDAIGSGAAVTAIGQIDPIETNPEHTRSM